MLAIILSMLTVVSVGCNFDISLDEDNDKSSSSSSKSDKNSNDKKESKDNKKQSDFSKIFDSDNKASSDIEDKDVNIATEGQTEKVTEKITEKSTEKSTEKTTEKSTTKSDNNFNIEHKEVLYDDNGLQILYIDSSEEYGYLDFNMYFQNNNDIELEVQAWEAYVNGTEIDAIMSAPIEAKGVYSDCMSFELEDLEDAGISPEEIKTVEVSFHIFNWNDDSIEIDTKLIKFTP